MKRQRPRLLDLFCSAGGCSVGYHRAGFDVVGVDINPQPRYPFEFHQADALAALSDEVFMRGVEIVHASPPCQGYSSLRHVAGSQHPQLIDQVRDLLVRWGRPYVIENVAGARAHMREPLLLCGSEFDLGAEGRDGVRRQLRRHRLFESNLPIRGATGCAHVGQPLGVYGTGGGGQQTRGYRADRANAAAALDIDWMNRAELSQAIPPAYNRVHRRAAPRPPESRSLISLAVSFPLLQARLGPGAQRSRSEFFMTSITCGHCRGTHYSVADVRSCAANRGLTPPVAKIVAGLYAVRDLDAMHFYKVDTPQEGRWAGYTFLKELFGAPGSFREVSVRDRVVREAVYADILAAGVEESMALFGRELGVCGACASPLTNEESRAYGLGPVCRSRLGAA